MFDPLSVSTTRPVHSPMQGSSHQRSYLLTGMTGIQHSNSRQSPKVMYHDVEWTRRVIAIHCLIHISSAWPIQLLRCAIATASRLFIGRAAATPGGEYCWHHTWQIGLPLNTELQIDLTATAPQVVRCLPWIFSKLQIGHGRTGPYNPAYRMGP